MILRPFPAKQWEKVLTLITAGFMFSLAWTTRSARLELISLNFEWLWPILLLVCGVLSLVAAWRHNELSWSVTTALITTTMLGRGIDVLVNSQSFNERALIAVSLWIGSGLVCGVAWLAIGAISDGVKIVEES